MARAARAEFRALRGRVGLRSHRLDMVQIGLIIIDEFARSPALLDRERRCFGLQRRGGLPVRADQFEQRQPIAEPGTVEDRRGGHLEAVEEGLDAGEVGLGDEPVRAEDPFDLGRH